MNKAILIGNLASDPDFRTLQSGIAYCTFRLAVQRRFANAEGKREADFINIVCWRQTAELAQKFLRKGSRAAGQPWKARYRTGATTRRTGRSGMSRRSLRTALNS